MKKSDKSQILEHKLANTFVDNVDAVIFEPALKHATSYDCMVGYFNSKSFHVIAKSLVLYLRANLKHKMRFIVSPHLSKADLQLLLELYENPSLLDEQLNNFHLDEYNLAKNTILALAYLLKNERVEIKIALPKSGLFHVKCWLFKQSTGGEIVIHGSGNHTFSGLSRNFEYLVVEHSQGSPTEEKICNRVREDFERLWNNRFPGVTCGILSAEMISILLSASMKEDRPFTGEAQIIRKLEEALLREESIMDELDYHETLRKIIDEHQPSALSIPNWLDYKQGDYKHQGEAIDAWVNNRGSGILSIATGGGKTLTSLTAASLLKEQLEKLLIVIAVPTVALMTQWADEVKLFNVTAINTQGMAKAKKIEAINTAGRNLRFDISTVEVIILTHDALQSDLMDKIEKFARKFPTLLIADEVHNLGSLGFKSSPPQFFKYKLGLSATPARQFDDEGTNFLFDYFGQVVYEYPLSQAIGNCLVHFNYYVHLVHLTAEEEDDFYEMTKKISKLAYAAQLDKDSDEFKLWSNLCIQRRRIIETAINKIKVFSKSFPQAKEDCPFTLVFCSGKAPKQLLEINQLLNDRFINYHQITSEETANPKLLFKVVEDYNAGILQVLTSKQVLDEGFNVPSTKTAYILASNTTKKQWVQRLGRVLRKAPDKNSATIHDFVVLPNLGEGQIDAELKSLLKAEAERIRFFVEFASNGLEKNGAVDILTTIAHVLDS